MSALKIDKHAHISESTGQMMKKLLCRRLLSREGWRERQSIEIDPDGRISAIEDADEQAFFDIDILIPAPANLHSHAFQRAMAGVTEARGPSGRDSFWTWRRTMFRFLDALTPDDVEAIAAFMQMESLEAGFGSVAEFHYLHHQPGGAPYARLSEMSERIVAAAERTGCGLTLLPVLYSQGGCDGRELAPGQVRFGNDLTRYARLYEECGALIANMGADARLGAAPHSLRAVRREDLNAVAQLAGNAPVHMHLAEQVAEVEEVQSAYGARPVDWMLKQALINDRWCLIHATQMTPQETVGLAQTGSVAGLCPLTEANLGDGVFDGVRFFEAGGAVGVGTDSNIQIDLASELRQLEYSQRLRDRGRSMLATSTQSTGRRLLEAAAKGGAQAAGRGSGVIEPGAWADLVALDASAVDLVGKSEDALLDAWIFTGAQSVITDVWSAGRHVVEGGRHIQRDAIRADYLTTIQSLGARI